jgi:hypothetical protein
MPAVSIVFRFFCELCVSQSSDFVQIRSIISISAGDALQTEMVINCDIIPRLAVLSRSPNVGIRSNAFLM